MAPEGALVVDPAVVAARAAQVRARIAAAGADPGGVRVVAVTKGQPASAAAAALAAGILDLGESYGQELLAKARALAGALPAPRWHAIGRVQRNKVRAMAAQVQLWQSVDRLALAEEIARRAPTAAVLVQVNVTGEGHKGGCPPEQAAALVEECRRLGLEVRGLMALGPAGDLEAARRAFSKARALADALDLEERSMGMSADLEAAVAEGSTMVRVGEALFGARPGALGVAD